MLTHKCAHCGRTAGSGGWFIGAEILCQSCSNALSRQRVVRQEVARRHRRPGWFTRLLARL